MVANLFIPAASVISKVTLLRLEYNERYKYKTYNTLPFYVVL